jgi:hypothetical protein
MNPRPTILVLALMLGGCSSTAASVAMVGIDVVAEQTTGRSVTGHIIHAMTGRECEASNVLKSKPICAPIDPGYVAVPQPPAYCYRSLAGVTCHPSADPFMSSARLTGAPEKLQ